MTTRTLDVGHALLEDLLEDLGVLKLLLNLGNDGLGQLPLLSLLDLALVSDPRLKNGLGLGGESSLLLELKGLSLELGGFLFNSISILRSNSDSSRIYLGNLEERLGDVDNLAHLLDVLNASLDGLGVVGTSAVEDVLDLGVLRLGPLLVRGTTILDQTTPDGEQAEGNDSLLVHDIVLVAEGVDADTGSGAEDGALAEQVVAGDRIDDALGLLLGLLGGNVAVEADGGSGDGGSSSASEDRSEEGSACVKSVRVRWWPIEAELESNCIGNREYRGVYVPTALRAKRDAIVRWFVMGYRGLVVDRKLELRLRFYRANSVTIKYT